MDLPKMEMENRRLWLAIAERWELPSERRLVHYRPLVHAGHGGFGLGIGDAPPPVLLCRLNQVQLLCTQDFHVVVRYHLEPVEGDLPTEMPIEDDLPILDPGIVVHDVPMTHADLHGNSFTIPPRVMVCLFPLGRRVPRHVMVRFMGLPNPFRLRLENLRFTVGWAMLRHRVQFRTGDRLLLTRMEDGSIALGVRRAANPINAFLLAAEIRAARDAYADGDDFEVDEYPRGWGQSVVHVEDYYGL